MIVTILNILHFVSVICCIYTGYKLYKGFVAGQKLKEQKDMLYAFATALSCIWIINIIIGFII